MTMGRERFNSFKRLEITFSLNKDNCFLVRKINWKKLDNGKKNVNVYSEVFTFFSP